MVFNSVILLLFLSTSSIASDAAADTAHGDGPAIRLEHRSSFGEAVPLDDLAFCYPSGVAVDHVTHEVYIADTWNNRIQVATPDGGFLRNFKTPHLLGISVDPSDGSVLAVSPNLHQVIRYDRDGTELARWGEVGKEPGQLRAPHDVSVHPDGHEIYVVEHGGPSVTVYDPDGGFLRRLELEVDRPFSVDVSPDGDRLWVAATGSSQVLELDPDSGVTRVFGDSFSSEPGRFRWVRGVAAAPDGGFYVADTDNERVQHLSDDGEPMLWFRGPHSRETGAFHPRQVAVDLGSGEVFAAASYAHRIDRFSADGVLLNSIGQSAAQPWQLWKAKGVAVHHGTGDIFVAELVSHKVKRFSSDGAFIAEHRTAVTPPPADEDAMWSMKSEHTFPTSLAMAPDDSYWVLSQGIHYPDDPIPAYYLRHFALDGSYLGGIHHPQLLPQGRGVDVHLVSGDVFVANTQDHRLMRFTAEGELVWRSAGPGGGPARLLNPAGVAVDEVNGVVWVADVGHQRIAGFDIDSGAFVGSFGEAGSERGQLGMGQIQGLAVDERGWIWVPEAQNQRVQAFTPRGSPCSPSAAAPCGPVARPPTWTWSATRSTWSPPSTWTSGGCSSAGTGSRPHHDPSTSRASRLWPRVVSIRGSQPGPWSRRSRSSAARVASGWRRVSCSISEAPQRSRKASGARSLSGFSVS